MNAWIMSLSLASSTLLAACGGAASAAGGTTAVPSASSAPASTATPTPIPATNSDTPYSCPAAQTSSGTLDCTKLPLGDLKYSSSAQAGSIMLCHFPTGTPAVSSAPWLNTTNGTWNATQKIAVSGSVTWSGQFNESVNGSTRTVASDGVPVAPITTGTFPIQASDPAAQYDRNPNAIGVQTIDFQVPSSPAVASTPTCLAGGAIGITVTGVTIYDAFDGAGYDGVAREEQDYCHGHPDQSSTYHYHGWLQACVPDSGSATQNSSLLGYAADGFGIYGPWYNGKVLTTADLDECHGTTSPVMWDGQLVTMYHYVSTYDFPYTLGCYRGTPVRV